MTQAVIAEGPLPEGQKEVVSGPIAAVREGPLKYLLEDQQLKVESQAISGEMPQSYGQELLPRFPWQEDPRPNQGETNLGFEETNRTEFDCGRRWSH